MTTITHHKNGEIKTLVEEAPYHPGYEDAVINKPRTTAELIEQLDNRYGNPLAPDCKLIQEGIKLLRLQQEEIKALMEQLK